MSTFNAFALLAEMANDWSIEITKRGERFSLIVVSYRDGSNHRYSGNDLSSLVSRAYGGERGD